MPTSIVRRLNNALRSRLGLPPLLEKISLLDRELIIQAGTWRHEPDYDDAWLLACALHARCIFDIGANVGQSALKFLVSPELQELVLVDANPVALSVAADNLIRNRLSTRVRFVCAFVGEADNTSVRFWTVGTGAAGSMYAVNARTATAVNSSIEIPVIMIDTLCDLYDIVPDLVKIDVEGAEMLVLRGSIRCVRHRKTRLQVEMHSNTQLPMEENAAQVLTWCEEQDYHAWYLSEAIRLHNPEQIAHRGRCHLLLQPADWPYPDWLKGIRQASPIQNALT